MMNLNNTYSLKLHRVFLETIHKNVILKTFKPNKNMRLLKICPHFIITILTFFLFLFCGCSHYRLPPPAAFNLEEIDTTPIKGKIIVIDPGHGGIEKGAVGLKGLKESEVNIGVALHLWSLLKAAGAEPVLTRYIDSSVYKGEDFTLKKDLQSRAEISNTHGADLFLSIHHNASENNKSLNELIIFHKTSDSGRSRDAAQSIIKRLKPKIVSDRASVLPGNYHVLRNTEATAILGEASFISSKANEKELSFQRTSMREAKGYFLGIVDYFSKGVPKITLVEPENIILKTAEPLLSARIDPGNKNTSVSRKDTILTLDNKKIESFNYDNQTISFIPDNPLYNSTHTFCLRARNSNGNISKEECFSFKVSLAPAIIIARPLFSSLPADGTARNPVDIEVFDRLGRPVADNTEITISPSGGFFLQRSVFTKSGKARAIFISPEKPQKVQLIAAAGKVTSESSINCGNVTNSYFMATLRDPFGRPVASAEMFKNKILSGLSDSTGFVYDNSTTNGKICYELKKKGYYQSTICPELKHGRTTLGNLILKPVDNGTFFNRKIILDPAGKDKSTLPLILELKRKIEDAGGKVILSWSNGTPPSKAKRANMASLTDADIFISFENSKKISIGHYFRSEKGKQLADKICFQLGKIFKKIKCKTKDSTEYVLVHTPMPAVLIKLPNHVLKNPRPLSIALYNSLLSFFIDKCPPRIN
jgi:N-acetylmuramoyl-L-alanine amidase